MLKYLILPGLFGPIVIDDSESMSRVGVGGDDIEITGPEVKRSRPSLAKGLV